MVLKTEKLILRTSFMPCSVKNLTVYIPIYIVETFTPGSDGIKEGGSFVITELKYHNQVSQKVLEEKEL